MRVGRQHEEALERVDLFIENSKIGEQKKMALDCIFLYCRGRLDTTDSTDHGEVVIMK